MKTQSHNNKKLIQQIALLIVIVIAIIFLLPLGSSGPTTTPPPVAQPINTQFDTEALKQLQEKESEYPNVTPTPAELGKKDPFS